MKNYRKLVPIVLVFMMLFSIYNLFNSAKEKEKKYLSTLEEARSKAADNLMVDAISLYNDVLNMRRDVETFLEIGAMYENNGTLAERISWGNYMVENYPKDAQCYEYLMRAYYEKQSYKECFKLYDECVKRSQPTELVNDIYKDIEYEYELSDKGYSNVKLYAKGYCGVCKKGLWGFADETGKEVVAPQYLLVGYFHEMAPVVTEDKEAFYIDPSGNRKFNVAEGGIEAGFFDGSRYALLEEDSYSYYNANNEFLSGPYDYASTYNYEMSAVYKDGLWFFINAAAEQPFEENFDDVILDEKEIAYRNERAFVAEEGSLYYKMIDLQGNMIGTQKYENAQVFLDFTYTAVKIDGKWGFIDKDANIVIEPQYEDALAFCNGYAAVKRNGKWGYIDNKGTMVIEPVFDGAKPFNSKGCVFVLVNETWNFLTLLKDNH